MKSTVVHNFIDRKVEKLLADKKGVNEIKLFLTDRVNKRASDDSRFKEYIAKFAEKRINDINLLESLPNFKGLTPNSLYNLIKLRDKITGKQEFDL